MKVKKYALSRKIFYLLKFISFYKKLLKNESKYNILYTQAHR